MLREFRPDVVVLAWEVIQWIDAEVQLRAALSDVPLRVVLGAQGNMESNAPGVTVYVPKPFDIAAIRDAVMSRRS